MNKELRERAVSAGLPLMDFISEKDTGSGIEDRCKTNAICSLSEFIVCYPGGP